ncbi:hypothetical protein PR202_gb03138 [Eleusine coracana subsp. coracana]|uniref:Uncharacterized protein n=1 Tax=Eleusine coracana subsp. coracana TaxID=191504 RepID=A0AAV5E121_ELECO|nr:hypothetical protein QOZ80_8BG0660480 [Eleusine coracana subsp. coracana]GJN16178.1 hypothetical protein PR202_gb03138 [Eleusine coracana subsp. coracana]
MARVIVVNRSPPVIVRPSSKSAVPPTRVTEKLSSFDKPYALSLVTSFLVFEHPVHDAANTVKKALSQALVYYYPFAGRIIVADDGECHVRCHDEGATFVAATANCTLEDARLLEVSNGETMTSTLLDDLTVYSPAESYCPGDPLLLMQVTKFNCGGFVMGVIWNHGIADGEGMAQFLRAVGELACGFPSPSVIPARWDASLPSLRPSILELVASPEPLNLTRLGISIPLTSINRIKAEFRERSNGQMCTMFEAVAAVLWQCRTRAIISDPESMALLSFAVNMRKHVGAKDGYYGNCVATQQVMARSGALVDADIVDIVKMIKRAKDEAVQPDQKDGVCEMIRAMDQQQRDGLPYNTLLLSSWRNIGFEEPDFGGGTPERVMCYLSPLQGYPPVCVINLPCKGKDGPSNAFAVCVKEEHADAFVAELARFT